VRKLHRYLALAIAVAYVPASRLQRRSRRQPIVLTYHTVAEGDREAFEAQMRWLAAHTDVVFADGRRSHDGRTCVSVTFDDAFQSVFDTAAPILASYRIPMTVFVPTGFLGQPPGWSVTPGTPNPPSGTVVAPETLSAVDPLLVKVGSHTVTHPRLAAIPGERIAEELTQSRRVLEHLTGRPVDLLALPYGSFSAQVLSAAERAGYARVFANIPVRRSPHGQSLLVGRINASPRDSLLEFRLKATGAYEWMAAAIAVKRRLLQVLRDVRKRIARA
jgi:peptidoglycan/xylan/chitin deacetylase (PgdA/CDA1 family)